ncbi:MAG TPA: discoidin domain-containing protein [Thermoanaerobaculia bacterium]|nr:discoidin domain-containing protein [Thermoanaerobaculia bacterium]
MKKLALLAGLLAIACEREPAAPPQPARERPVIHVEPDPDADNLLSLAYGAAVVSRTGEVNLESSAVHAIDNLAPTAWVSAPGAWDETIVYSLLAPARITQVGITVSKGERVPRGVAFDTSMDGKKWREVLSIEPANDDARQLWPVKEAVARYIRVRSLDRDKYYIRVRAFHAIGEEVEPPSTPPFTGCWTVNGLRANIVQQGARVTGIIEADPPIHLEGGTDNRVALMMWKQGPTWGYAALTRTPDGAHLTGLRLYNEFDVRNAGDGWFGERCSMGRIGPMGPMEPMGPMSLYGLVFDEKDNLVEPLSTPQLEAIVPLLREPAQRVRIISHELRYDTPDENRRRTAARIATLRRALQSRGVNVDRIEFVAAGSDWSGPSIYTTLQRLFASRVELSFGT